MKSILFIFGFFLTSQGIALEGLLHRFHVQESLALGGVKDVTLLLFTRRVYRSSEDSAYQLVMKKGEKFRIESTDLQEPLIIGRGKEVWSIFPSTEPLRTLFRERVRYPLLPKWSELIPKESEIIETDKIEERLSYKIEVKRTWLSPFSTFYVDLAEPWVLRVKGRGGLMINYSDYREIAPHLSIPFCIDIFQRDMLAQRVVKFVEIDQGLPDILFDLEKGREFREIPRVIEKFKNP